MLYLIVKFLISGLLITIISEVSKKYPGLGGLIASLPLISIIGIIWLWQDTNDPKRIIEHSYATLFFVIPSLPFFVFFPICLKYNFSFFISLLISCSITIALYLLMIKISSFFGIKV